MPSNFLDAKARFYKVPKHFAVAVLISCKMSVIKGARAVVG